MGQKLFTLSATYHDIFFYNQFFYESRDSAALWWLLFYCFSCFCYLPRFKINESIIFLRIGIWSKSLSKFVRSDKIVYSNACKKTKETSWATNQSQAQSLVFLNIRNKDPLLHRITSMHYSTKTTLNKSKYKKVWQGKMGLNHVKIRVRSFIDNPKHVLN